MGRPGEERCQVDLPALGEPWGEAASVKGISALAVTRSQGHSTRYRSRKA